MLSCKTNELVQYCFSNVQQMDFLGWHKKYAIIVHQNSANYLIRFSVLCSFKKISIQSIIYPPRDFHYLRYLHCHQNKLSRVNIKPLFPLKRLKEKLPTKLCNVFEKYLKGGLLNQLQINDVQGKLRLSFSRRCTPQLTIC